MVAQLLRLRIQTLLNAFRGEPRAVAGRVLLLILAAAACYLFATLFQEPTEVDPALLRALIGAGGSVILLGCFLVPLVSRVSSTLDPRGYAGFGIAPRTLAGGLILSGLLSLPTLVLLLLGGIAGFGLASMQTDAVGPALATTVLVPLTGSLLIRLGSALGGQLREPARRGLRGLVSVVLALLAIGTGVLALGDSDRLAAVAGFAGWTPLGAPWLLTEPGSGGALAGRLAIAVLTVIVLFAAWGVLCTYLVRSVSRPEVPAGIHLGWFARVPAGATAAVAARSLTYWLRDPRYITSLLIVPVVPIVAVFALNIAGVSWSALSLLPLPIILLFIAWAPHNDLALDSSALWLHVTSGVSGRADRIGRILPVFLLGVLVIAIGAPISVGLGGVPEMLPVLIGVCGGILLTGLGLASYFSARTPYPAVQPGDSPFQQPQAGGGYSARVQALSLIGTVVLSLPVLYLATRAYGGESSMIGLTLAVGLGVGVLVLILGVAAGARYYTRHTAELMEFATSH
ncbi:hypothetical protein [Mycetocola saprophilus]|uniref:hypothetical protein n=1 Tax=Mycetocola saprophilus TaxID=76636 RepID=UPI0004C13E16|nr:hypothetical protein [Mycetocola saprophilus]